MNHRDPRHNRRSLTVCLVALAALFGCSTTNTVRFVSLPDLVEFRTEVEAERISSDPLVYRFSGTEKQEVFGTTVRECGVRDFVPSQSTTRQLLVGLTAISIRAQERVSFQGRPVLRTELTALLDAQPLEMVTYTIRNNDCVTDMTFWRPTPHGAEEPLRAVVEEFIILSQDSQ